MFGYYSDSNDSTRVTVVGTHAEGVLKVSISMCSKKDRFVRKKGRMIAEGRLKKGVIFHQENMAVCDVKKFVEVAKEVVEKANVMAWNLVKFHSIPAALKQE